MGVVTVIYGVLMLLVGTAAWAEIGSPAVPALLPIIIGAVAIPLGVLGGDLRARRATTGAVFGLAVLGLLVSIPGTIATLSRLFDPSTAREPAMAQVASFVVCGVYIAIVASVWIVYRRRRRRLEAGYSPGRGRSRPPRAYAATER